MSKFTLPNLKTAKFRIPRVFIMILLDKKNSFHKIMYNDLFPLVSQLPLSRCELINIIHLHSKTHNLNDENN